MWIFDEERDPIFLQEIGSSQPNKDRGPIKEKRKELGREAGEELSLRKIEGDSGGRENEVWMKKKKRGESRYKWKSGGTKKPTFCV